MDTLTGLKIFALVADLRSFAAAAERSQLSPAMVTKHLQRLESRLGARLLNRTSRHVSLTEAGAAYLDRVRPLLEGLDEAESHLSNARLEPSGTLRVSLPVWLANPHFVRLIAAYRLRYPQVTLDFDLSGKRVNLVEDGYDLALRVTATLSEGLVARRLADISFYLVASPGLLSRIGTPTTIADLEGLPFLAYALFAATGHVRIGTGTTAQDVQFRPVLQSGNETLLHHAAQEGMGVAILPHSLLAEDLHHGRLVRLLPDLPPAVVTLYAVYPERSFLPAKTRSFLDFLAESGGLSMLPPKPDAL